MAAWFIYGTPQGRQFQDKKFVHAWVHAHPCAAPTIFVVAYMVMSVLLLPVWWLQIVAGHAFGLVMGVVWCQLAATIGAVLGLSISRWLVGGWFRARFETRIQKLHFWQEKMGHNGLLVVMAVRLLHVLPFAISNYLFGLTPITIYDVAIGTLWGGIISTSFYAGTGAGLLGADHFWAAMAIIYVILCIPLALRYLRPQWFARIGVE